MARAVKEEKSNGSTTRSIIIIGALFFYFWICYLAKFATNSIPGDSL